MEVIESLLGLRFTGIILSLFSLLWTFFRFRVRRCDRNEFFFISLVSFGVMMVAIDPDIVNILAQMLSLQDQQFGRIITLLIVSNVLLGVILLRTRERNYKHNRQFDNLLKILARDRFIDRYNGPHFNIIVVIPAFNEADNLKYILPRIPLKIHGHSCGCLVVDDGSSDNTSTVVIDSGHMLVSGLMNRGGGSALRLGYDIALNLGAEIVVTMDADGQHLPEEIERLVNPILEGEDDIVIGSRLLGSREKDSFVRLIGIYFFNSLINLLSNTHISDCSNGFRAFKMDSLKQILLTQDQFHTAELIIDAARRGMKIGEAPVTVVKRYSGESKKGENLFYGFSFWKTIMSTWLRK